MAKIRVGIIFGGKSSEHEVSINSAKSILQAIDREKYEVTLIGIDKNGHWHLAEEQRLPSGELKLTFSTTAVSLDPMQNGRELILSESRRSLGTLDVVFPVLHGRAGEDGTMQGLLTLAGIPFVGADTLGSAVGMDKEVMKRLLRDAGLPVGKFQTFTDRAAIHFSELEAVLGLPFFVKPANTGSSVGIHKVHSEEELEPALNDAWQYDHKLLIEEYIAGEEVECAVLGNTNPIASLPGKVKPNHEFYDYDAKYLDEHGANFEIPAQLPQETIKAVQDLALKSYQALCCSGMGRVDMFLTPEGKLVLNEINTIPGFTTISMYPKLWEVSGISYPELIDRLIGFALERAAEQEGIQSSYLAL